MNKDLHFSSKKNDWGKPNPIFNYFDKQYNFNLDPAATHDNMLCSRYYTVELDGLTQSWANSRVFLNPPYGRDIGKWLKKAYEESKNNNTLVVCLLPARTDTSWFWDYCKNKSRIIFLKGRIKFKGAIHAAPFPSMIVIYEPQSIGKYFKVEFLDLKTIKGESNE